MTNTPKDKTPMTERSPHSKVFEYDGAFSCGVCGSQWGALPGKPEEPKECVPIPQNVKDAHEIANKPKDYLVTWILEALKEKAALAAERQKADPDGRYYWKGKAQANLQLYAEARTKIASLEQELAQIRKRFDDRYVTPNEYEKAEIRRPLQDRIAILTAENEKMKQELENLRDKS